MNNNRRAVRSRIAAFFAVLGFIAGFSAPSRAAWTFADPGFFTETVTTLPAFTPVGLTWAPDGRMFIWTKNGTVRIFKNGTLLPTPFINISNKVNIVNDRGLLGLALDPAYATNGYVYLLYTYEEGGNPNSTTKKVSLLTRVTSDPGNRDVALAGSETIILGSTATIPCPAPGPNVNCIPADDDSHSIGTLRFAADGTLFVGNGDAASYNFADPLALRSLDLNSMAGKILHINKDGTAVPGNPFYDGTNSVRSKVWAYGLRNPYRFTLHPITGIPYTGEVGWVTWEEVNKVTAGANFGWPCFEGNDPQPEYQQTFTQCQGVSAASVTKPLYTYFHDAAGGSSAIGGPVFQGNQYPVQYAGTLFFADYSARWIRRIILDANGNFQSIVPFASDIGTTLGGAVSLELGPDGLLYYVEITTGIIGRIKHVSGGGNNLPPVANASATPTAGYSPLTVNFSSAGSSDPEAFPITYSWNFGDGTTSTSPNPTKVYTSATVRTFNATLTVTDNQGATSTATVPITVGSLPPTATIITPADQTQLTIGQTVTYQGSGTDPDDGTLPASALSWTILLHHNTHAHVAGQFSGTTGGSFLVEDHDPVGTYAYEIILTVTDSSGISATKSVLLPVFNPNAGPIAAYAFDEGTGSTAADASGHGNTATLVNAPAWTTAGKFGNALTFDGLNDAVSVANPSAFNFGTADFTIMAWVKRDALGGAQRHLFSKCDAALWVSGCKELYFTPGDALSFGSFGTGDTIGGTIADANWHHIAVVFTKSTNTLQMFIDGALTTTATKALEADGANHVITIGNLQGTNTFSGTIDEMRLYARAVNVGEILTAMGQPINPPTPDTTPPSNPSGLTATAAGGAQINLAWTASTDTGGSGLAGYRLERCQGAGCTNFAQIASPVSASYNDTGLTAGTSYSYRVRAIDGAGNLSAGYSNVATATTTAPDTTPPSDPSGLSATASGSSQIGLTWTASTDAGGSGLAGYRVERCQGAGCTNFAQIATPASNSYADSGLAASASYSYRVRAVDGAGNLSVNYSNVASATTGASTGMALAYGFDETAGTSAADASGNGRVGTLVNGPTWSTAGKYSGALSFDGVNDAVTVANPATLNFGTADFTIMAWVKRNALGGAQRHIWSKCDAVNWVSGCKELYFAPDNTLNFGSFATGDTTSIAIADTNWHHVAVTFVDSTNAIQIYVDGVLRTSATKALEADGASHVVTIGNLHGSNTFSGLIDEVRIYSRALSTSEVQTDMNTPITPIADTTAPVISNGLPTGTLPAGTTQTTLSVATNENATCRYATTAGTAYASMVNTFATTGGTTHSTPIGGLANGQSYTFYVRCQDAAGNANTGDFVVSFSVAAPDAVAPTVSMTAPANGATVSGTVTLSANASDNVGVVGVQFLLDGANLGAELTAAPYTLSWNTLPTANGAHTLSARARDAAGNQTTSTVVNVTVSNLAPTGLVAAWGMNEGTGTSIADASGNGHLGTLQNGPAWVAGKYGNGLSFDGINDNVSVAAPSTFNFGSADFTIMAWVKRNALGGAQRHIFSKCHPTNWVSGCKEFYFLPDNRLAFGSFATSDTISIAITDALWHHVAVTFTRSSNTVRIYVDGTLRTTGTKNLEADNASHVVAIGNMHGSNTFSGSIDEVRVYSRALSAAEITTDMNTPIN